MSDLVGYPEDQFSHNEAHIHVMSLLISQFKTCLAAHLVSVFNTSPQCTLQMLMNEKSCLMPLLCRAFDP